MGISVPTTPGSGGGGAANVLQVARVVAITDQTLSGTYSIDGVALSATNRVLLTDQITPTENGLWVVDAGSWSRPSDYAAGATIQPNVVVPIAEGTTNGDTRWQITDDGAVVVDTDPTTWGKTNLGLTAVVDDLNPELGGTLTDPSSYGIEVDEITVADVATLGNSGGSKTEATGTATFYWGGSGGVLTLSGSLSTIAGSTTVTGAGTAFTTQLRAGDAVSLTVAAQDVRVVEVVSDSEIRIAPAAAATNPVELATYTPSRLSARHSGVIAGYGVYAPGLFVDPYGRVGMGSLRVDSGSGGEAQLEIYNALDAQLRLIQDADAAEIATKYADFEVDSNGALNIGTSNYGVVESSAPDSGEVSLYLKTPGQQINILQMENSSSDYAKVGLDNTDGFMVQATGDRIRFGVGAASGADILILEKTISGRHVTLGYDGNSANAVNGTLNTRFPLLTLDSSTPGTFPYSISAAECNQIVHIKNTSGGAVTIYAPAAASCPAGSWLEFKDASGTSGTDTITIDASSAGNIDGQGTQLLSADYAAFRIYSDGASWFISP